MKNTKLLETDFAPLITRRTIERLNAQRLERRLAWLSVVVCSLILAAAIITPLT